MAISGAISSQDLNGFWGGKLNPEPGGCFPEYFIELQIHVIRNEIVGTSYDFYDTSKFVKLSFTGSIDSKKKQVFLKERSVLVEQIPSDCMPCLKTYQLTYNKIDNEERLTGRWIGEDIGTIIGCPPGAISLSRISESKFAVKKERIAKPVQTIYVDTSDVTLEILDNGIVDDDSVSIKLNDQWIINKQRLSLQPIKVAISLQELTKYDLQVYAESLGTIAPNTSLLRINSRGKKYEILLSSLLHESDGVILIYQRTDNRK